MVVVDPAIPHPRWVGAVEHLRSGVFELEDALGCDIVFHVAGVWDGGPRGDGRMRRLNVEGTRHVLGLGAPVVYTSSSITCGFGPWEAPGTEEQSSEDPAHPIRGTGRVYRETKLEAEALVAACGGHIVNPDYVVGPGDVGGVVTTPLIRASRLPAFPAPRGGKCFVGVDDVGEGHVLAWERGRPGIRHLLGAENRRYGELLQTLASLQGRRLRLVPLPRRLVAAGTRLPVVGRSIGALEQMNLERYRDATRARTELGWAPKPVDLALSRMVESR